MKAASSIGNDLVHTTDRSVTGTITDIVFDTSLGKSEFYLADVATEVGTAPLLFSSSVLIPDGDAVKTSARPEDIAGRVKSTTARLPVPVDPGDLPSSLIGPFGNTIAPSMLAALFNARNGSDRPELPGDDKSLPPNFIRAKRGADDTVLMSLSQADRARD